MVDWTASMQQTFEYYVVDPKTWKDTTPLRNVTLCTVSRDSDADSLGSASLSFKDLIGECYVRIYLVTIQNGVRERHPLGTFLIQTPSSEMNGKTRDVTVDAYTPLLELKEKSPPLGYSLLEGENIMDAAYRIVRENTRAPVVPATSDKKLHKDFVADPSETWLPFTIDLVSNAKYELSLDEMGRVLFAPKQDISALQPVWTYDDGNSSILYPEISLNHDLYGVPNVVEVIYSVGKDSYYARVVNDDSNSPTSTVSRGREIVHRVINPTELGDPTQYQIDEYAKQLLKELSSVEYTISYTHAYCGTRVGDCVRLNYEKAGLKDVKAKIISQSIKCSRGCAVSEKAVFTTKLWG